MARAARNRTDIEVISDDIVALKRDLSSLMSHVKGGAVNGVDAAASAARDEAVDFYGRWAAEGTRSAQSLRRKINQQPVTSLLVALAVGFVGGRVLR